MVNQLIFLLVKAQKTDQKSGAAQMSQQPVLIVFCDLTFGIFRMRYYALLALLLGARTLLGAPGMFGSTDCWTLVTLLLGRVPVLET